MTFNLSRIRLTVQLVMLVVTVYGGAVVGHYMADKISTALPALSCAFDNQDSGFCVLIPFQHQLHHRVGKHCPVSRIQYYLSCANGLHTAFFLSVFCCFRESLLWLGLPSWHSSGNPF